MCGIERMSRCVDATCDQKDLRGTPSSPLRLIGMSFASLHFVALSMTEPHDHDSNWPSPQSSRRSTAHQPTARPTAPSSMYSVQSIYNEDANQWTWTAEVGVEMEVLGPFASVMVSAYAGGWRAEICLSRVCSCPRAGMPR